MRHYRKIRIEGLNLSGIVNKCIRNGIPLKNLKWKNPLESTVEIRGDDLDGFRKTAGHSYRLTMLGEGGLIPFFKSVKADIIALTGAFLLGALLFYQGLFIAEIRIDGYRSVGEEEIRRAARDAGLYEGARKPESYDGVKKAIYENFEDITWVDVREDGRLIEVDVAEASEAKEKRPAKNIPVDIIAARSGIIERILPLQGDAVVEKGDYVNKGDVLISGAFEYQSSDYSRGDDIFTMYSRAAGQALARAPRHFTYYMEKNERTKKETGRFIPGIRIRAGDLEVDTASWFSGYEASVRKETKLITAVKPLPLEISLVKTAEVDISERPRSMESVRSIVDAAIRQYERERLKDGEKLLGSSVDYSESAGLIRADVLLEVLEDIGEERAIDVKKESKKADKDNKH